jgi:hypothetical protein
MPTRSIMNGARISMGALLAQNKAVTDPVKIEEVADGWCAEFRGLLAEALGYRRARERLLNQVAALDEEYAGRTGDDDFDDIRGDRGNHEQNTRAA